MARITETTLRLWQGTIETRVELCGEGSPLVYLHGPWGLGRDRDFLLRLAGFARVCAPFHPGTTPGDPEAIHRLDDWLDLVLYHGELFDRLGLAKFSLIGHSCGGMLAAELAAAMPERVEKLVLIDPLGLWRDDLSVRNWMIMPEGEVRRALFAEPEGAAAARFFELPQELAARAEAQADFIWAQACTGKFLWPIPDRGLNKRIHRIAAPTLVIWGARDVIIAPEYARDFAARIAGARTALVEGAGHLPHLEEGEDVARLVRGFIAG
jgi:pimeloyl-ACP methyl ester carboxylesterase